MTVVVAVPTVETAVSVPEVVVVLNIGDVHVVDVDVVTVLVGVVDVVTVELGSVTVLSGLVVTDVIVVVVVPPLTV